MAPESLDQHRRELDATFELLKAMREHAHADAELDRLVGARLDALAGELRAVANRVESLTRAVGNHESLLTTTGNGVGFVSRAEVDRMIEEAGFSVKARPVRFEIEPSS